MQMDVDYTGRVRQSPGANSVQVGGKHDVRDEEEEEPLQHQDADDHESDARVPSIANPVQETMNQMNQDIKKSDSFADTLRDGIVRSAAAMPFSNIDAQDSLMHKADEVLEGAFASEVSAAAAGGGVISKAVDLEKKVVSSLKEGAHGMKAAAPGIQAAQQMAGMHLPKLIKDVQEDVAVGDTQKLMTDVQDHLKQASEDFLEDQIKNLNPAMVVKAAADAAQLANDVKSAEGQEKMNEIKEDPLNGVKDLLYKGMNQMKNLDPATEVKLMEKAAKLMEHIHKAGGHGKEAQSTAGAYFANLVNDIQEGAAEHDMGTALADITSRIQEDPLRVVKDLMNQGMDQMKNLDLATTLKITADAAKLVEDIQKAGLAKGDMSKTLADVKEDPLGAVKDLMNQGLNTMKNLDPATTIKITSDAAKLVQDIHSAGLIKGKMGKDDPLGAVKDLMNPASTKLAEDAEKVAQDLQKAAEGDMGKVLADMKEDPLHAAQDLLNQGIDRMKNLDPAMTKKVEEDAAKLVEDIQKMGKAEGNMVSDAKKVLEG